MTTRIFIADDHQLFGEGLKELLLKQPDFEVCGPFKESEVITYSVANLRPHILLLDINLGKTDGLELGKELKKAYPEVRIIMLTMYENEKMLARGKEYGMDGYLLKDCETHVLLGGIREVMAGGSCFTSLKPAPVKSLTESDRFLVQYHLSERETEIMEQVKLGLSNQQIADILSLSYHTVKTHRKNIYLKLGVSNVAELIEFTAKFPEN